MRDTLKQRLFDLGYGTGSKTPSEAIIRIEQLERERDLWSETAAMHLRAEQAFLSWLRAAGEHMRDEGVTLCDDGVDSGDILAAKVAECAGLLKARAEAAEAKLAKAIQTLKWYADFGNHVPQTGQPAITFDMGGRAEETLRELGEYDD